MAEMATRKVYSSHGVMIMAENGAHIGAEWFDCAADPDCHPELAQITRFDLDEWRRAHKDCCAELPETFDILDLAYWYKGPDSTGQLVHLYEPAESEFRQDATTPA